MPEGIIIKGDKAMGKSTTVMAIKEALVRELSPKGAQVTELEIEAGECKTLIELAGKRLFILSVGDDVAVLRLHCGDSFDASVGFVVGVARTSGKTVRFWQERLNCRHWKKKLAASDAEQQTLVSFACAEVRAFFEKEPTS